MDCPTAQKHGVKATASEVADLLKQASELYRFLRKAPALMLRQFTRRGPNEMAVLYDLIKEPLDYRPP